jgi:hypothetical protein
MFSRLTRESAQCVSVSLMVGGILLAILQSSLIAAGVGMALACWVMLISESVLLQRIQTEMNSSLGAIRKKRDNEINELLYFLRRSNLSADPFHSWEAAKIFVGKINFPAFLMSPSMGVIKANDHLEKLLGYSKGEIDGWPVSRLSDVAVMSQVGSILGNSPYQNLPAMHLRYFYLDKEKKEIHGVLAVTKIIDGGFMMVFHPDCKNLITVEQLEKMSCRA